MSADLETRLRDLPDRLAGLRPPAGLAGAVRARHRRRRRLLVAGSVAAVLVVAGGGAVTVATLRSAPAPAPAVAPAPPPRGPLPTDRRLLQWPGRGPLIKDTATVRAVLEATKTTYRGDVNVTPGPAHVLWIGPFGNGPQGAERVAVTQRYLEAKRSGVYIEWYGDSGGLWRPQGNYLLEGDVAGYAFSRPAGPICDDPDGACPEQDVRVLLLGAPDATAARYAFPGGAPVAVPLTDGAALSTTRVTPGTDSPFTVPQVSVTRRGRGETSVGAAPVPLWFPRFAPSTVVEWSPPRGLPPLLDAPETFPALDLWGRLHGLPGRPGYGNPVWGGTLADGSKAALAQPTASRSTPNHLVFGVTPPGGDTFLVRDLPNPADPATVAQVSAYLPLSDGRCELVVVGRPGTTAVSVTEAGRRTDLAVRDGVGTLVVPSCDGHGSARLEVGRGGTTTYAGPVDSTKPGGGVRR